MADIKIDISTNIKELGKSLDELAEGMVNDVQTAVGQLSRMVENEAIRLAQQRLNENAETFVKSLKREQISDNVWVISINSKSAEKLENGYGGFDMKPGFMKSKKVKIDENGKKYLDIPIEQHPFSGKNATTKVKDMRSAVEAVLKDSSVTQRIQKFNEGSQGMNKHGDVTFFGNIKDERVQGLVKVTPPGKSQGQYLLIRRVTEDSPAESWMHPGFSGANIFPDLEKYAKKELENILKKILGG